MFLAYFKVLTERLVGDKNQNAINHFNPYFSSKDLGGLSLLQFTTEVKSLYLSEYMHTAHCTSKDTRASTALLISETAFQAVVRSGT